MQLKFSRAMIVLFITVMGMDWACSNQNVTQIQPQDCTAVISLSTDVMPIIKTNCAVGGCHVAGTGLSDFSKSSNVIGRASQIQQYVQAGVMPPRNSGRSLSSDQVQKISCWVIQGAANN